MKSLQYDHFYNDELKQAQRRAEDAIDAAKVLKKQWIDELTEQAAIDILDRIIETQNNAAAYNLPEDKVRQYQISDLKLILRQAIRAVQYADEKIG